ncbi:MAG: hypothetical protein KIT17_14655 [Rubrivivax sp.]|nr:hypothetical protein [Rubrivivax sp.]
MKLTGGPSPLLVRVLQALRPLVRLLVHHGITYTALAAALKPLFLDEARRELQRRGMPATDSALTLLSGVHRRDVRTLTREPRAADAAVAAPAAMGLASEVVGRWMGERRWLDRRGHARVLPRAAQAQGDKPSFDALVESVSRDVRPRAVLDELVRLGVAEETSEGVRLLAEGFAPKRGFDEMAALFAANLHDHAAAAVANLRGDANFLEQAVFVDELGEDSVHELAQAAKAAWQAALRDVMAKARERFDADQARPRPERRQRARFGVYFYSEAEE